MVSFLLSLVALVLGYLFYGKFVVHVFGPDDRPTPAVTKGGWGRFHCTAQLENLHDSIP